MNEMKPEQVVEVEEQVEALEGQEQEGNSIAAEIHIQVLTNGGLSVGTPEGFPELKPAEMEQVVRQVYEQLHDMRIASMTFDMIKQRLG